nr:MAG TPA: hypothetical protein [Caudoviricetes sp.]
MYCVLKGVFKIICPPLALLSRNWINYFRKRYF